MERLMMLWMTAVLVVVTGCGDAETKAKKEYAIDAAGESLSKYGGYDKLQDVTVTIEEEEVTVNGVAIRKGATHDFTVKLKVSESDELLLTQVLANQEVLFVQKYSKPVVVNDSNFEEVVLNSDKPVLVDFWATWCKPCELIAPIVEELAHEYEGRAVVAKLDIDDANDIRLEYEVSSIPTLIVFKNGEEVSRVVGVQEKSVLSGKLDEAIEPLGTSD